MNRMNQFPQFPDGPLVRIFHEITWCPSGNTSDSPFSVGAGFMPARNGAPAADSSGGDEPLRTQEFPDGH
jgi:hypothetical protein